jgi:extracellular factor (EF) 3-hydroxypalmitic acid methyl ester biosynthesis protein
MANRRPLVAESVVVFRNSQHQEARGTLVRLTRHNVVFEVYNPYSIVQLSEVLVDVRIRRADRDIYSGKAVVTNLISTGLMLIVSASLVDPWSDLAGLAPGPDLRAEVENFVHDWTSGNRELRPSYQVSVSNIRNFLQEFSRWLEHGEMVAGVKEPGASPELVDAFVRDIDAKVSPKLIELFDAFEVEARQVPEDLLGIHKEFARREIHPLMLRSPFMHRSYTKPLGYAGDYIMVNMLLGEALEGTNSYAKIVNGYCLRTVTARAHRNRIDQLTQLLTSEAQRVNGSHRRFQVLNVGCGPAAEVQRFVAGSALADGTDIELVDFNEETLEYARGQIDGAIRDHRRRTVSRFTHRSVHQLLKQASGRGDAGEPRYDLVYCAGLFDYLSDRVCGRLLKLFYGWTLPGGLIVATNVHTRHPGKGFMEHLQEWNLILRAEDAMLSLAPELPNQKVSTEATGANIFLEIRKAEP